MKKLYGSKRIAVLLVLVFVSLLAAPRRAEVTPKFKVIANNSVDVTDLSRKEISKLFLKKVTKWDDNTDVYPVDLPAGSSIREMFSEIIHQKSIPAVKAYWQQQIFSGSALPPSEKASEQAVISYVRETRGAIGYVSADADVRGVRVLRVE